MKKHGFEDVKIDSSTVVGKPGYYGAGKDTEGRWWFLRPDGRPFIYKGCCAVCDGVPPSNGKPGNAYWYHHHSIYGAQDDHRFALDAIRILDDVGFNAFGMWCFIRNPNSGVERLGWPYVIHIHAREVYPEGAVDGSFLKTIDAFDPGWERAFNKACADKVTAHAMNTNLFGYFTDNEPFWGQPMQSTSPEEQAELAARQDNFSGQTTAFERKARAHRWGVDRLVDTYPSGSLLQVFMNLPPERPGHQVAWKFALDRHGGNVQQLARDWGAEFSSPDEFHRKSKENKMVMNSAAYGRDHEDFTRLYVQTYYRVTGEAIRRYDPNHMRLGVRHHARAELHGEVALREYAHVRQHVEVFSMNTYSDTPVGAVRGYARYLDMPILIGEYTWGGWMHDGRQYPPEFAIDHAAWLRQEGVRRSAEMFTIPQLTGYTWFKWYGGSNPDNTAYAVVTEKQELNRFNAPMLRRYHAALEDVHAGLMDPNVI